MEKKPQITIGITTYNRKEYLEKMSKSLYQCQTVENCNIRIYDDCSDLYDNDYLKSLFPTAKQIIRRKENLGPDGNMRQMFLDFLASGDDYLFVADADLIFHPHCLCFILENIGHTEGIMGLYNSSLHPDVGETQIGGHPFVEKEAVGAAGIVKSKEVVEMIVSNVPLSKGYDWGWSKYVRSKGLRIFVSKRSYVQHIGMHGANCDALVITDLGINFLAGNELNEQYQMDFFHILVKEKDKELNRLHEIELRYNSKAYKLGKLVSKPIVAIAKLLKLRK